jgi:putative membrane protein
MYLGTQGDEWDAQKDMAAAFVGSIITMAVTLALSKSESLAPLPA